MVPPLNFWIFLDTESGGIKWWATWWRKHGLSTAHSRDHKVLTFDIPWAGGRRTIHHQALSDRHGARPWPPKCSLEMPDTGSREDKLLAKTRIAKKLLSDPILQTDPLPCSWGWPRRSRVLTATLRASHRDTGQGPGRLAEARGISAGPSGTRRRACSCVHPDLRLLGAPLAGAEKSFKSFTFLTLANNNKPSFDKGFTRFIMSLSHWVMLTRGTFPEVSFEGKGEREKTPSLWSYWQITQEEKIARTRGLSFSAPAKAQLQHPSTSRASSSSAAYIWYG